MPRKAFAMLLAVGREGGVVMTRGCLCVMRSTHSDIGNTN